MARINIEDSIYKDLRFSKLLLKVGSLDAAIGCLVRAWSLAQQYWLTENKLIPKIEWITQGINNSIIECGLAEERGEFVYVCGSEKQFQWIQQRSIAGSKSSNGRQRDTNGRWISDPTSISISNSSSKYINTNTPKGQISNEIAPKTNDFIAVYVKSFQKRYNARPPITGKISGQIKNLLKTLSPKIACEMVQVYLQMDDPWFIKKKHDIGTFIENLNKIAIALQTGGDESQNERKDLLEKLEAIERGEDVR